MNAPRVELRPVTSSKLSDWARRIFARSTPRARVVAPRAVHLGGSLEVEWGLEHGAAELTLATVALVGTEIARRRVSARSGISIITETRPFVTVEIDRRPLGQGGPVTSGRATVIVPAHSVPTLAGRLNEIAWTIVVEASFQAVTILRREFPLAVHPVPR